jgi:two-component system, sensor histidine kinase
MANRTIERANAPRESEIRASAVPSFSVLVVDDDQDSADGLAMLLRYWSHRVAVAYEGLHAIQLFRSLRPDLVLLDIDLPGMDGYEVAGRMLLENRNAYLVALTGSADRKRSIAAGFMDHIRKPFHPDALRDLISAM